MCLLRAKLLEKRKLLKEKHRLVEAEVKLQLAQLFALFEECVREKNNCDVG